MPRIGLKVTPLGLNLIAFLGLTNARTRTDLAASLNSSLALYDRHRIGILMFRLLRPLGVEWTVQRKSDSGILGISSSFPVARLRQPEPLCEPDVRPDQCLAVPAGSARAGTP